MHVSSGIEAHFLIDFTGILLRRQRNTLHQSLIHSLDSTGHCEEQSATTIPS